jgi:hypothetical protein
MIAGALWTDVIGDGRKGADYTDAPTVQRFVVEIVDIAADDGAARTR